MANVLLIDDDPVVREIVRGLLVREQHQVTCAEDGAAGLALADRQAFDLVVTDMLMPVMDGVELIAALRRQFRRLPIIAMSAGRRSIGADFNLGTAELLGATRVVAKPVAPATLKQAVDAALAA